jgi:hypothetical protein
VKLLASGISGRTSERRKRTLGHGCGVLRNVARERVSKYHDFRRTNIIHANKGMKWGRVIVSSFFGWHMLTGPPIFWGYRRRIKKIRSAYMKYYLLSTDKYQISQKCYSFSSSINTFKYFVVKTGRFRTRKPFGMADMWSHLAVTGLRLIHFWHFQTR